MENNENKAGAINDDKLKRAATAPKSIKNADNHDLGPWDDLPIGNVPEVNGPWAREVRDFVPTTWELLEIARQWAGVAIERTYVEWANATVSVSTKDWRRIYFAWRRVYRIRALLGEVIDKVVDDQIKKFHQKDGARWDPATWENFLRLIDREAQRGISRLCQISLIRLLTQALKRKADLAPDTTGERCCSACRRAGAGGRC